MTKLDPYRASLVSVLVCFLSKYSCNNNNISVMLIYTSNYEFAAHTIHAVKKQFLKIKMLHPLKKVSVMLHPYFPITATSPRLPLWRGSTVLNKYTCNNVLENSVVYLCLFLYLKQHSFVLEQSELK